MSDAPPPPPPPPPPHGFMTPGRASFSAGTGPMMPPPPPHSSDHATHAPPPPVPAPQPASWTHAPPPPPAATTEHEHEWSQAPVTRAKALSYAPSPAQYSSAAGATGARRSFSSLQSNSSSFSGLLPSSSSTAPAAAVVSSAPALVAVRADLADIVEKGRATFAALKEYKSPAKKYDADGRLVSLVNKLWYRLGFLISAKYIGAGSDHQKEQLMLLAVLCEVRQTMMDLFDHQKAAGEKVNTIIVRHAWLFTTSAEVEELVSNAAMRLAQSEGSQPKTHGNTLAMPPLLEAPLTLFEDRLGIFAPDQKQSLFDESGALRSLRSQVESYLNQGYEPALVSLFVVEAVGKAMATLLLNRERRKLYFPSLLATYSCGRANSWILLLTDHGIDLGKLSDTKLTVTPGSNIAGGGGGGGLDQAQSLRRVSVITTADSMRASAGSAAGPPGTAAGAGGATVRALPTDDTYLAMMAGVTLTGYFHVPSQVEPVVQRMQVWLDRADGASAHGSVQAIQGKKCALFYVPEGEPRVQTADCMLPIAAISEILLGKQTTVLQSSAASRAPPACCVTLVTTDGYSLNFEAASPADLATFMGDLTKLANASGKRMTEESEHGTAATAHAQPQQQQQHHDAPPSFSTDGPPLLSATHLHAPPPALVSAAPNFGSSPPLLSASHKSSAHSFSASSAGGPPLPPPGFVPNGGWVKCTAPEGHTYYFHAERNQSVWEKPPEYLELEKNAPSASARMAIEF